MWKTTNSGIAIGNKSAKIVVLWRFIRISRFVHWFVSDSILILTYGVRHKGCFSYSSTGALVVDKVLFAAQRSALVIVIDKYLSTVPDKAYTEEFLFYNSNEED